MLIEDIRHARGKVQPLLRCLGAAGVVGRCREQCDMPAR